MFEGFRRGDQGNEIANPIENMRYKIKQKGFTLIELMITVVIVGLLVSIATGSWITFQAKAKQSEAKINLGAIGEMALSYRTEYETYITSWTGIGWQPNTITRYRYWYNGTAAAGTPTVTEVGVDYSDPGSTADGVSFTAYAVGNIDYDVTRDIWSINESRDPQNPQNDPITP